MHPMLNIAIRAVRKGGNIILQNYDAQKFIQENIEQNKIFIKNIMYKTYRTISEIIYKSYPNHIVVNKNEDIFLNNNQKNIIWIINELNGKTNFIKNFPHFCISIAVTIKNNTEISVIYDPIRNDLFTAVKGQGSQLNGYRTRCSDINNLNYTTIAVNLPDNYNDESFLYYKIYTKLISYGISFRFTGSSVLDLAYVACGKIDCLFDLNKKSNNLIAGKLQIRESGCLTSSFQGSHENSNSKFGNIISSPKIIRLISKKIHLC